MSYSPNTLYGVWKEVELRKNKLWVIPSVLLWVRPNGEPFFLRDFLITDYATIPKVFRPIFPHRHDAYDLAAAFHDDCLIEALFDKVCSSKCHNIFLEIMEYLNVKKRPTTKLGRWWWKTRAQIMYRAVVFADFFYTLHRRVFGKDCVVEHSCRNLTAEEIELFEQIKTDFPDAKAHFSFPLPVIKPEDLKRIPHKVSNSTLS